MSCNNEDGFSLCVPTIDPDLLKIAGELQADNGKNKDL
jgi:hypothetical protein